MYIIIEITFICQDLHNYQSQVWDSTFINVADVAPGLQCTVQYLSPNLELYLVMAAFEISAESGVAGGGLWTATLVSAYS